MTWAVILAAAGVVGMTAMGAAQAIAPSHTLRPGGRRILLGSFYLAVVGVSLAAGHLIGSPS